jgi:hypothetical protein
VETTRRHVLSRTIAKREGQEADRLPDTHDMQLPYRHGDR